MYDGSVWDSRDSYNYIWPVRNGQAISSPAPLWKTGQTICYDSSGTITPCAGTGQDGEIQAGVAWPEPRFTISGDCVTDNLTGLMWAQNANLSNGVTWQGALNQVASMNNGSGLCGQNDWRLPNRIELRSLVDYSQKYPALPLNHPFNIQPNIYWTSTSSIYYSPHLAWVVPMSNGVVGSILDNYSEYYWPVRGGR